MCGIIGIASNKSVSVNIINALKKTAQLVPNTILSNILFIVTLESLRIDLNIYKPD